LRGVLARWPLVTDRQLRQPNPPVRRGDTGACRHVHRSKRRPESVGVFAKQPPLSFRWRRPHCPSLGPEYLEPDWSHSKTRRRHSSHLLYKKRSTSSLCRQRRHYSPVEPSTRKAVSLRR